MPLHKLKVVTLGYLPFAVALVGRAFAPLTQPTLRVSRVSQDGVIVDRVPRTFSGIAWDSAQAVFYVSDAENDVVLAVDRFDGTFFNYAGGGPSSACSSPGMGDFGLATSGCLRRPHGLALGPAPGTLYIADTFAHAVRFVDSTGVLSTVAGDRSCPFSADQQTWSDRDEGGPATNACIASPWGLAVHPTNGALLVSAYGYSGAWGY